MSPTPPNIVIIAIDSLRADHLGCYGYHMNTSPAIDALAGESVVFDHAFAAGIPTMPS
ncbi:MAG TPA: sulfatase-like hydrolase/transferase, partial [Chloroflexota bacterium]|nr:sulfatase-like hydrolase/transferase [Chloroflexota bacterium]